jgi:sec-independent protein translocase protein TatC
MALLDYDRATMFDAADDDSLQGALPDDEDIGPQMTLIEHLGELRRRLFYSVIAVAVTTIVAFIFHQQMLRFLELPLAGVYKTGLITTGIGEGFTVTFVVALGGGIALATPVWIYQLWAFIAPALTRRERKYALPFTFIGVALFFIGLGVGFLTLRFPVSWLLTFGQDSGFRELISASNYFTFILYFMLAFGVTFLLPLVMTFLSVLGIINSKQLAKNRAYSLVGLWILATIITPGADPYSPIILGAALTVLYLISEVLIRAIGK